jgi:retron-type reverse transcriptase
LLTELGEPQETLTGTPQGGILGILSPLLASIALSALDEHLHRAWESGGVLSTSYRREKRRAQSLPSWRLVRYADLCRARHKSAYAESRIMPALLSDALVRAVIMFPLSA